MDAGEEGSNFDLDVIAQQRYFEKITAPLLNSQKPVHKKKPSLRGRLPMYPKRIGLSPQHKESALSYTVWMTSRQRRVAQHRHQQARFGP